MEVNKWYFWHNRIEDINVVVCAYKQCQLVKRTINIKSKLEEFKSIPIWDQFYSVAFNTIEPLLEITNGNKYILVAINHYLKWCETKVAIDRNVKTMARFLEDEFIYMFGVLKYILTNNGFKWSAKFDQLRKNSWIIHQYTMP